jgi:tRNA threonylcarbamoyladenosine biosynthesis protein TsaB
MAALCIDTATEDGLVAVAPDDGPIASVTWRSAGRHGENLFGYIDAALSQAKVARDALSIIGVDIGPGRFTSLRVGLATAKGLALGLGIPIVGVSSLRVLARSMSVDRDIARVPTMDAYRGDIFAAAYVVEDGVLREISAPSFGPPDEVLERIRTAAGERQICKDVVAASPEAIVEETLHVMRVDGPADLARLEPQYLRPSDAKLPDQPLRTEHSS